MPFPLANYKVTFSPFTMEEHIIVQSKQISSPELAKCFPTGLQNQTVITVRTLITGLSDFPDRLYVPMPEDLHFRLKNNTVMKLPQAQNLTSFYHTCTKNIIFGFISTNFLQQKCN
jgi:hypothetical protein